ncbi:MAG TPA: WbqC family protein [Nitrospinota bacterium]|jgi:hypothetical protein|nr:WbqC family protein [Nitrospinota bacterium]
MKIGGLQPSYLPWLGYFEQIHKTDLFILCDELQYEKYSWRNRNRIRTKHSLVRLIVPVVSSHTPEKQIKDIKVDYSTNWRKKHWLSLFYNYNNSPFFKNYMVFFKDVLKKKWEHLSDLNIEIIRELCRYLNIKTEIVVSSQLKLEDKFRKNFKSGDATDRIIFYCNEFGANTFYEGKAGKNYVNEEKFAEESIKLEYQNYQHPVYPQTGDDFISHLSAVDLLFNCGEKSLDILLNKTGRSS